MTGASSGIGEELVKQLVTLGTKKLIIAARRVSELERVKKECGETKTEIEIWQLDLSDPKTCLEKA